MREKINEEVSVVMYYSAKHKKAVPYLLNWQNKDYSLTLADYEHGYMDGQVKLHIFEMVDKDNSLWFRLKLNSSNLHWTLEVVHDGLAT